MKLLQLVEQTLIDTRYILMMMYDLNVVPLALQITSVCGNTMVSSKTSATNVSVDGNTLSPGNSIKTHN